MSSSLTPTNPADEEQQKSVFIKGLKCPACGSDRSLFVASGNYITCSIANCPNPDFADALNEWHREGVERAAKEARYMGSADVLNWVINHDESSFRAERAWFKLKPALILRYQAELMKNLNEIHTNMGLDIGSTVPQLKHNDALKAGEGNPHE